MSKTTPWMIALACATALACAAPEPEPAPEPAPEPMAMEEPAPPAVATAHLMGAEGSDISGEVVFTEGEAGTTVTADVTGVPAGTHGFHVHETGDCSAADFTSAGGHFNPAGVEHGGPDAEVHHAGDLGNIEVGEDGTGHLELTSNQLTVGEGEYSVVGRAVILHEGADDLTSQPTGAAGARLACGVVEAGDGSMMSDDTTGEDMDDSMDAMGDTESEADDGAEY